MANTPYYVKAETDAKLESVRREIKVVNPSNTFDSEAEMTAYWNNATEKPQDTTELYRSDLDQIWAWDSSTTAKAVFSRDYGTVDIESTDNIDDPDQTKVAEISTVKSVDEKTKGIITASKVLEIKEGVTKITQIPTTWQTGLSTTTKDLEGFDVEGRNFDLPSTVGANPQLIGYAIDENMSITDGDNIYIYFAIHSEIELNDFIPSVSNSSKAIITEVSSTSLNVGWNFLEVGVKVIENVNNWIVYLNSEGNNTNILGTNVFCAYAYKSKTKNFGFIEYQISDFKREFSEISNQFKETPSVTLTDNAFNKDDALYGAYINGTYYYQTSGSTWYVSDFIEVEEGDVVKFYNNITPVSCKIIRYNSSKSRIDGETYETYTAVEGDAYLHVEVSISKDVNLFQILINADTPTEYVNSSYNFNNIKGRTLKITSENIDESDEGFQDVISGMLEDKEDYVVEKNVDYLTQSVNVFDPTLAEEGKLVSSDDGSLANVSNFNFSGWQEVKGGSRYYMTSGNFPTAFFRVHSSMRAYKTADGQHIDFGDYELDDTFITPANAAYLGVSNQINFNTGLIQLIEVEDILDTETFPFPTGIKYTSSGYDFNPEKINVKDAFFRSLYQELVDEDWVALGDSQTAQGLYFEQVRLVTGVNTPTNLGVSGQLIGTMADDLTQQLVDDCKLITIYGGTNNYGHGTSGIGDITDVADKSGTTYAQIRYILETIYGFINTSTLTDAEKLAKKIVFVTPTNRGSYGGESVPPAAGAFGQTLLEVRNAIIDVCDELSTPVWDAYSLSGCNQLNLDLTTVDELHYTTSFGRTFGYKLGKFVNNI